MVGCGTLSSWLAHIVDVLGILINERLSSFIVSLLTLGVPVFFSYIRYT